MPYLFDHTQHCHVCPYGGCIEDRRVKRVRGRNTEFRVRQTTAMQCTFAEFVPGTDNDPDPARTFDQYLAQFRGNADKAGATLFGSGFGIQGSAYAKVEGDVFELMEAAAIWNAFAVWNGYMLFDTWDSEVFTKPEGAIATPARMAAILKLPRGYDTTRLFKPAVRANIQAHENALRLRGMELGLSSPDIVGIRIPDPMPDSYTPFLNQLKNLDAGR